MGLSLASVFPICIDGYGATRQAINAGDYTFGSSEHAYVRQVPPAGSLAAAAITYTYHANFQMNTFASAGSLSLSQSQAATSAARDKAMPEPCATN